jgi:hypothetical protein
VEDATMTSEELYGPALARQLRRIRETHEYDSGIPFQALPSLIRVMEEAHEDRGVLLMIVDKLERAVLCGTGSGTVGG